ncbi:MAG: hypothetical protein R2822_05680 [Spirosomataceae bacterium]
MTKSNRFLLPLLVVMGLMFIWNLSRNINDVLIPHQKSLSAHRFSVIIGTISLFAGYFLLALPVGQYIRRFGYRAGMITDF